MINIKDTNAKKLSEYTVILSLKSAQDLFKDSSGIFDEKTFLRSESLRIALLLVARFVSADFKNYLIKASESFAEDFLKLSQTPNKKNLRALKLTLIKIFQRLDILYFEKQISEKNLNLLKDAFLDFISSLEFAFEYKKVGDFEFDASDFALPNLLSFKENFKSAPEQEIGHKSLSADDFVNAKAYNNAFIDDSSENKTYGKTREIELSENSENKPDKNTQIENATGSDNTHKNANQKNANQKDINHLIKNALKSDSMHLSVRHQKDIEKRRIAIINALDEFGPMTSAELAKRLKNWSVKTVQRELRNLLEKGVIKKEGKGRWTRYSIP